MTDKARLPGIFHGINFVTKSRGEDQGVSQKVQLAFSADMDAVAQEHVLNLIRWSKQPVLLEVSKQQLSLEDGQEKPQGALPLPAAAAAPAPAAEASAGSPGIDLAPTWFEREVLGPDDILHDIFVQADGKAFACWDCGGVYPVEDGEVLEDEIKSHACKKEEERACRICGCTEDHACQGGCFWVERDLCSNYECLMKAGYSPYECQEISEGKLPLVWLDRTADIEVRCADGTTRKFEVEIRDNRINALLCDACGEPIVRTSYGRGDDIPLPPVDDLYGLARNHRCPDLCHKCRAQEKHGAAMADLLILHRPGCPQAFSAPTIDGLLYQLSVKPYAARILEAFALDPKGYLSHDGQKDHVTAYILEDAAEALARIEDLAGIQPAKMRPATYAEHGTLQNYNIRSILAELKKTVKEKKDKVLTRALNTILAGIKEAQEALKKVQHQQNEKEMQNHPEGQEPGDEEEEPGDGGAGDPGGEAAEEKPIITCHKCDCTKVHPEFGERLLFHTSGCPDAPEPEGDFALPYFRANEMDLNFYTHLMAAAPEADAGRNVCDDIQEAFIAIEKDCGLKPTFGWIEPNYYVHISAFTTGERKRALKAIRKKSPEAARLAEQLLADYDTTKEGFEKLRAEETRERFESGEEVFEEGKRASAAGRSHLAKVVIQGPISYVDDLGRPLVVADTGEEFGVFRRRKEGGLVIVRSIPFCDTFEEAEKALEEFARKCGFLKADSTREAPPAPVAP